MNGQKDGQTDGQTDRKEGQDRQEGQTGKQTNRWRHKPKGGMRKRDIPDRSSGGQKSQMSRPSCLTDRWRNRRTN